MKNAQEWIAKDRKVSALKDLQETNAIGQFGCGVKIWIDPFSWNDHISKLSYTAPLAIKFEGFLVSSLGQQRFDPFWLTFGVQESRHRKPCFSSQGKLWKAGYEKGELKGEMFEARKTRSAS